eukprot:COSAG06_NODE_9061_length_1997_cov_28.409378_3_plen_173_part_00
MAASAGWHIVGGAADYCNSHGQAAWTVVRGSTRPSGSIPEVRTSKGGRVPQALIDELIRPGLGQKDVRLRSVGPNARLQEARRRLNDPETTAGKPGTNLCRYAGDDTKMAGFAPAASAGVRLCRVLRRVLDCAASAESPVAVAAAPAAAGVARTKSVRAIHSRIVKPPAPPT